MSDSTQELDNWHLVTDLSNVIDNYVTRIIGVIGIIFNIFFLSILYNKKNIELVHNIYRCFRSRALTSLAVSVIVAIHDTFNCRGLPSCNMNSYYHAFYNVYVSYLPLELFLTSSIICDVILSINRYFVIIDKKNSFTELSTLSIVLISFASPILLFTPLFFGFSIYQTTSNSKNFTETFYIVNLTPFGTSKIFSVYSVSVALFQSVIPVTALAIIGVISVRKFKRVMQIKSHLTKNQTECKKAEVNYTRSVLITTNICVITRFSDLCARTIVRLIQYKIIEVSLTTTALMELLRNCTYSLLFLAIAIDGVVYLVIDTRLKQVVSKMFK